MPQLGRKGRKDRQLSLLLPEISFDQLKRLTDDSGYTYAQFFVVLLDREYRKIYGESGFPDSSTNKS